MQIVSNWDNLQKLSKPVFWKKKKKKKKKKEKEKRHQFTICWISPDSGKG